MNIGQQGWGQATAAMQQLMRQGLGVAARGARATSRTRGARASRSRKRAASSTKRTTRRTTSKRASSARLKKGSAAAKRHMAKLRAMVGKRRR